MSYLGNRLKDPEFRKLFYREGWRIEVGELIAARLQAGVNLPLSDERVGGLLEGTESMTMDEFSDLCFYLGVRPTIGWEREDFT